jgi:hypothetical protein
MAKQENKKPFSTRLDPALIKRVKTWAIANDMSLQEATTLALEDLLKKRSGPK